MIEQLSSPGVCEAHIVRSPGVRRDGRPDLLIEVPHGATGRRHYDALRRRLVGPLVDDLEAFFFVNTDVGSFETALRIAEMLTSGESSAATQAARSAVPRSVLVLRCLVPRTFVDCNRVPGAETEGGAVMTPALPEYVTDPGDRRLLLSLHARYTEAAQEAFRAVCGPGRPALILHTYAPRSIEIERIDDNIVPALRRAYSPERYGAWPRRPDVDVISELGDGTSVAPRDLADALRGRFARIGIDVEENATYRLVPGTMGHVHSVRYPDQVLCIEINRELLADPFTPFEEMRIGDDRVTRMAAPIAAALTDAALER